MIERMRPIGSLLFQTNFRPSLIIIIFLYISLAAITIPAQNGDTTTRAFTAAESSVSPNEVRPQFNDGKEQAAREYRASEALELVADWSSQFGRDIHYGTQEATCFRSLRDQFDPAKSDPARRGDHRASVASIDWTRMHADIVRTISNTMGWHKSAVEAIARASEMLASNHTFDKNLHFEYLDVHRLQNIDEIEPSPGSSQEDSGEPILIDQQPPLDGGSNLNSSIVTAGGGETMGQLENQEVGQLDANGQLSVDQTTGSAETVSGEQPAEQLPKPASLVQQQQQQQQQQQRQSQSAPTSQFFVGDLTGPQATTEWQTPFKQLKFIKHRNFDVLINTEESAVHTPVHIFAGEPQVMNAIAWSDGLTKVFRDNFIRNSKLTNQYFASQLGFLRVFPAQMWQIGRLDPDLYDARMRPWYAIGASSRKDVIILVDSSGSMTGSRRDIAKGVVFEILDTLTDNDHFLILKFSDTIQQVGVPSCSKMRLKKKASPIPLKNTLFVQQQGSRENSDSGYATASEASTTNTNANETDIESLFLVPANGRNVRQVKSNFTISTSGIANFSHALITAFEVLQNYQDSENSLGSQCNQAIMLITDGSPSDFEEIFNRYNYPNAPVRVFTYLIGREAGDVTHTKMMACHNRGYYTHVINLAEVRETVQQYVPVMARPLVLNGTHPITWTPPYGELTYQILTDWIWESKRREKARAILAANGRGSPSNSQTASSPASGYAPDIKVTSDDDDDGAGATAGSVAYSPDGEENYESLLEDQLEQIDLFGYNTNTDCFWETNRNDLLTTVVQPVYDKRNESVVTEKFLVKNVWTIKETVMRTAQILGVAAADMKINDIISLAPSHKLGPNGYAIMLTNNGYAMHHPDLRSILEPFSLDPSERDMKILKPFFSSLDFTQVEHILNPSSDGNFLALRKEAVAGLTGWRELLTKRTLDCQKRIQSRRQSFYYKPIQQFPFAFMIAIPQPYGSHRVEAQIELKSASLPEKLTTYFTTSDYDLWTVHPDYQYCEGPSNNTIATLLDMIQRIEARKLDDIQWRPTESSKPPILLPGKIVCDKDLVQSLVYDAVATFGFSETCGPPSPNAESSLLGMFGIRFSFIATRSGLTRVRHYDPEDSAIKKEALAFAKKHARASDETFYSRTVDYNMLVNESTTLLQVPFNTFEKIRDRLNKYELDEILRSDSPLPNTSETNATNYGQSVSWPENNPSNPFSGDVLDNSANRLSVKDMNYMEKLRVLTNNSLHVIATQSIIVNEGAQKAVAGVTGSFYDYASFVLRFLNSTQTRFSDVRKATKPAACFTGTSTDEACDDSKTVRCGFSNDTFDCLLVDNNGYILVSEDFDFIGRHLKAYDINIMSKLVNFGVFHEINITDYQSVCMRQEEKQLNSRASQATFLFHPINQATTIVLALFKNLISTVAYISSLLIATTFNIQTDYVHALGPSQTGPASRQLQPMLSLLPNKTYLRPCEKTLTLYETRSDKFNQESPKHYTTKCGCEAWFVYEQVPKTNLIMLLVDTTPACRHGCDPPNAQLFDPTDPLDMAREANKTQADQVCSMLERESQLYRKKPDSCFAHHPDEEHIKICGAAAVSAPICNIVLIIMTLVSSRILFTFM